MALTAAEENIIKKIAARAVLKSEIKTINATALAAIKVVDDKRNIDVAAKQAEIDALSIPDGV